MLTHKNTISTFKQEMQEIFSQNHPSVVITNIMIKVTVSKGTSQKTQKKKKKHYLDVS